MNIYIETYGCSANQNNSEIMAGILARAGANIVSNEEFADVAIINTCIVKGPTQQRMISRIKELSKKEQSKKFRLVVAGCMPDVFSILIKKISPNAILLGSHNITKIANVLKKEKEEKEKRNEKNEIKLCFPKIKQNKIIGITQISEGCVGNCSFCIVKFAKGKLFSYPKEKIIENIKQDLQSGSKEIWLTSQDNAAYGLDLGKRNLPELLKEILSIRKKFFLRLGMMNPNNVLPILSELIECYKDEKMFKFLHVPLQSGSDKILKDMKRQYSIKDFLTIIKKFRKEFPFSTISTDIIVGYPTETEKDFEKTLQAIKKIKPEMLNLSRFWPVCTETEAKIDQKIVKERTKKVVALHKKICEKEQKKFVGLEDKCIVDKKGFGNTFLARNSAYKLIILKNVRLGEILNVKIIRAFPHYLFGMPKSIS